MQSSNSLLDHLGGLDKNNLSNILHHLGHNKEIEHSYPTSYYFDIEGFISQIPKNDSIFSVISLNIECLSAKFDRLSAFLQILSDSNALPSAFTIQESWLPADFDYSFYSLPGYNIIHRGYVCGKKGGLVTYIDEKFTINKRNLYNHSKHWEGLFIDIMHESLPKKLP